MISITIFTEKEVKKFLDCNNDEYWILMENILQEFGVKLKERLG